MDNYAIAVTEKEYTTAVEVGYHEHITDEPVSLGGKDQGPSPYDLLISALASCTSITLRLYADRKEWPVDKIVVKVSHNKEYRNDASVSDTSSKIDVFNRKIRVHGALSAEQLNRLLEIANKCPVHRILESDNLVDTSIEN